MTLNIKPRQIPGLTECEASIFEDLLREYSEHKDKNAQKARYYEGRIPLSEVNLGIALPEGLRGLEIGCAWGQKCVGFICHSFLARQLAKHHYGGHGMWYPLRRIQRRGHS